MAETPSGQEEMHLIDMEPLEQHADESHLQGEMRWIQEEKGNEYELVYVVDIDQSTPKYNDTPNAIIAKTDETYQRISVNELKSTQQVEMDPDKKLSKALIFAAERSAESMAKRGTILGEVVEEKYTVTTGGFLCFKNTETRTRKAMKGFEVCSYEWDGNKFNGFHTRPLGAAATERQYKSISNHLTVMNPRDPSGRELREKEAELEQSGRVIEKQKYEIQTMAERVQALQQKHEKHRRNSIHEIDTLQSQLQGSNNEVKSMQLDMQQMHRNMESERNISEQKQTELSMQISRLQFAYDRLKQEYDAKVEELQSVTEHRNILQDRLLEFDPDVQSLDSNFPAFQDIVGKFDDTRSQSRANCAKYIKKYFKSKNKNWHKLNISKKGSVLLFEVLISIYHKMHSYHDSIVAEYRDKFQTMKDDNFQKVSYKELKQNFQDLFDNAKQAYIEAVLNEIDAKCVDIFDFCKKEVFQQYVEDCAYCCWFIAVCQAPRLKLEPMACEYANAQGAVGGDDDNKEAAKDEIMFDDHKYVAAFGSEDGESLNYYVWPCIVREDTNFQLSKIHAVFLNDLPLLSKK
eukprot:CAMPEP_0197044440 /NCGR_PEP_ID=MMETSP1384-20130603/20485_1 /TAXON_ID=29189 /ORGANISM="Ammonia sp." /LENGTH=574 /DNA_ID=CAMNT_0042475889 /DNA_START=29 /DNA_END=1750 /DNA_ORIENTATION=-